MGGSRSVNYFLNVTSCSEGGFLHGDVCFRESGSSSITMSPLPKHEAQCSQFLFHLYLLLFRGFSPRSRLFHANPGHDVSVLKSQFYFLQTHFSVSFFSFSLFLFLKTVSSILFFLPSKFSHFSYLSSTSFVLFLLSSSIMCDSSVIWSQHEGLRGRRDAPAAKWVFKSSL